LNFLLGATAESLQAIIDRTALRFGWIHHRGTQPDTLVPIHCAVTKWGRLKYESCR